MISAEAINSIPAAFIAGLVTSAHCVGMCGPLACVMTPRREEGVSMNVILTAYHTSRVIAYAVIGALLGGIGQPLLNAFNASPVHFLPWAVVVFFLLVAMGADHWLPKPRFLTRAFMRMTARLNRMNRLAAGTLIGFATPFLPCGPLYLVFGLALVMGSPARGAEFLFAFGLGTLPLLFLVQSQFVRLRKYLTPIWMLRIQRGTAFVMALMLALRLSGAVGPGLEVDCPFCP